MKMEDEILEVRVEKHEKLERRVAAAERRVTLLFWAVVLIAACVLFILFFR